MLAKRFVSAENRGSLGLKKIWKNSHSAEKIPKGDPLICTRFLDLTARTDNPLGVRLDLKPKWRVVESDDEPLSELKKIKLEKLIEEELQEAAQGASTSY